MSAQLILYALVPQYVLHEGAYLCERFGIVCLCERVSQASAAAFVMMTKPGCGSVALPVAFSLF